MSTRSRILIGVLVFVVALVALAPAALLSAQLAKIPAAPQLAGVGGSVVRGSAGALLVQGRPVFRNLSWRFRPQDLLRLRLGADIEAGGELNVAGAISRGPTALHVDALRAAGDLRALLALTGDLVAPLAGSVGLDIEHATLVNGWPSKASGELHLDGLRWTLAAQPLVLGDFIARIQPDGKQIVAKIATVSGQVDAGGEVRINSDRSYDVDLQVKARPDASALVQNLVRSLGQPDPQGYYHLKSHQQL